MSDRTQQLVEALLDQAVQAGIESDWREVARLCREVLNIEPENSDAEKMLVAAERSRSTATQNRSRAESSSPVTGSSSHAESRPPTFTSNRELRADFVDLVSPAKLARIAIAITVVMLVVFTITTWAEINLLTEMQNGEFVTDQRIDNNDLIQGFVALTYLVVFVFSVIAFLRWLRRSAMNLPIIGKVNPIFTPGWVVGWWFVPLFFWFKPYQVMKEIWIGSDRETIRKHGLYNVWPWLGWFWAAHVTVNLLSWMSFRMSGDDLDSLLAGDYVILGSNIVQVLAGVLLLLYVERVTRNQRDWYKSSLAQAPEYSSHSDADPT